MKTNRLMIIDTFNGFIDSKGALYCGKSAVHAPRAGVAGFDRQAFEFVLPGMERNDGANIV